MKIRGNFFSLSNKEIRLPLAGILVHIVYICSGDDILKPQKSIKCRSVVLIVLNK